MTKTMAKKVSLSLMINIILGSILLVLAVFGYFYLKGISPVEVVTANLPTNTLPDYQYQFSVYGGKKDFNNPYEVLAFNNSIYVSDYGNARIVVTDRNGKFKKEITSKELKTPAGMFWDGQQLWVADPTAGKIFIMDAEGVIASSIVLTNEVMPADIVIEQGYMYLLNNKKMQVEKYDITTKKIVKTFGGFGKEDGKLYYPYDLGIRDGKVYVADSLNSRINIYDLEGKFISAFAKVKNQKEVGNLAVPRGITFDKQGRLFTVEGVGHRVTVIDQTGNIALNITKSETIGEDVQDINLPTDVTFDEVGRMYVLEYAFKRVLVYKPK